MGSSFLFLLVLSRFIYLTYSIYTGKEKFSKVKRKPPIRTLICIGSGGHTTEMIKLITALDHKKYEPRFYIMANNDVVSENKIVDLEKNVYKSQYNTYVINKIPRSRIVGQSYITSIITTLNSVINCIPVVVRIKPDLILCNGPGTCIPICIIVFIMKLFFLSNAKIIFIESICRVKSFSLSGHILMYIADNIVIHWEELKTICKRADCLGQLF